MVNILFEIKTHFSEFKVKIYKKFHTTIIVLFPYVCLKITQEPLLLWKSEDNTRQNDNKSDQMRSSIAIPILPV